MGKREEEQQASRQELQNNGANSELKYRSTVVEASPTAPLIELSPDDDIVVVFGTSHSSSLTVGDEHGTVAISVTHQKGETSRLQIYTENSPLTVDINPEQGLMSGVSPEGPFAITVDSAKRVNKVTFYDAKTGAWKAIPQPVNPEYIARLIPHIAGVAATEKAQLQAMADIATGRSAIKEVNAVLARNTEEHTRRNRAHKWGREMAALLEQMMANPPLWRMNGTEDHTGLTDVLPEVSGLRGLENNQFIWGTSFCRADIKEVLQYFSLSTALEQEGFPGQRATYFIDPNAHTLGEMEAAMARDFNIDATEFQAILNARPRLPADSEATTSEMADLHHLPPSFYESPSPEAFAALLQHEHLQEIIAIWQEAAQATQGKNLGDWRIEVDRITIRKLAERLGVDPDFVQVVDLKKIIKSIQEVSATTISTLVARMWTESKPIVQKAVVGIETEVDLEDMPMVYRLVLPDGKRIGINTDSVPIDLETRQPSESPFALQVAAEIKAGATVTDLMERYPIQFSGLGYYMYTKHHAMAEGNDTPNQVVMIMDDYEQSVGTYAAAIALREEERVIPFSLPKGLIAVKTDKQINFDDTPDACALLALPPDELQKVRAFIEATAAVMRSDDIESTTGIVIDPVTNTVSEVTRIPGRRHMMALAESDCGPAVSDATKNVIDYQLAREIPKIMVSLSPKNVGSVITGAVQTRQHVQKGIEAVSVATQVANVMGGELPTLSAYQTELEAINTLLEHGENIAKKIEGTMNETDWVQYWKNCLAAHSFAGIESGFGTVAVASEQLATREGVTQVAEYTNLKYRELCRKQFEAEVRARRPEHFVKLNEALAELDAAVSTYELARKAVGSISRLNSGTMNVGEITKWAASEGKEYSRLVPLMNKQLDIKKQEAGSDKNKAQPQLSLDDMSIIIERAKTSMLGSFAAVSNYTNVEAPVEIIKPNGRFNSEVTTWITTLKEKVAHVTNIASVESMSEEAMKALLGREVTKAERTAINEQYTASIDAEIQRRMEVFNEAYKRMWAELNARNPQLQTKLEQKRELEDRIHHEVIVPRAQHEQAIVALREPAMAEYTQWWNQAAQGLVQQGFPVI